MSLVSDHSPGRVGAHLWSGGRVGVAGSQVVACIKLHGLLAPAAPGSRLSRLSIIVQGLIALDHVLASRPANVEREGVASSVARHASIPAAEVSEKYGSF